MAEIADDIATLRHVIELLEQNGFYPAYTPALRRLLDRVEGMERVTLGLLRNPTTDTLNQAATDMLRDIEPLQKRAKILLESIADQIERALDGLPSPEEPT